MIDMHCHIVPFTDDGAKDVDTTLDMAREAVKAGYKQAFATSHYIIHDIENDHDEFVNNVKKLNELYEQNGIDYKIHPANEIFFTNNILKLIEDKKVSTLADSRYVLVEFPLYSQKIPMNAWDEFNELQDAGYIPVLAHPERYDFVGQDVNSLIPLIESGVLLQSNIGSMYGKYGKKIKKTLKKMLKRNMVHFFGTDSHNTTVYPRFEECMKKVRKIVKDEEMIEAILTNPEKILNNEKINIWYPKEK